MSSTWKEATFLPSFYLEKQAHEQPSNPCREKWNKKKHFSSPAWELRTGNKDGCNSSSGFMSQNLLPPRWGAPRLHCGAVGLGRHLRSVPVRFHRMSNTKCQECVRGRRRRKRGTGGRCDVCRDLRPVKLAWQTWVWNSQGRDRSWEPVNETYGVIRDPPSSLAGSLPASPTVGRWGPVCLYDSLIHLLLPPTYNTGSRQQGR